MCWSGRVPLKHQFGKKRVTSTMKLRNLESQEDVCTSYFSAKTPTVVFRFDMESNLILPGPKTITRLRLWRRETDSSKTDREERDGRGIIAFGFWERESRKLACYHDPLVWYFLINTSNPSFPSPHFTIRLVFVVDNKEEVTRSVFSVPTTI